MTPTAITSNTSDLQFYAFGTTRIFEKRAAKLKLLRTWITFLGIVIPVIIGGTVLAFGANNNLLPYFIGAAGLAGVIQLSLSTWSIVARWDEAYEYALDSTRDNTDIFNKTKSIIENPPADLLAAYTHVKNHYEERERKDLAQAVTEKEKRFANRESLKYFRKTCHVCGEIPKTSTPSKCDGCGNF